MFSPAHILSFICVNFGGAGSGVVFARVGAVAGLCLSLGACSVWWRGHCASVCAGWARVPLLFLAWDRKLLLLSPAGRSWDRMGWIEPCTALTSTTVQTGWVSTGASRVGWDTSNVPSVPRACARMCLCVKSGVSLVLVSCTCLCRASAAPFAAVTSKECQNPN